MLQIKTSNRFEKDLDRQMSRKKDMKKLRDVVQILLSQERLPDEYRDHQLKGRLNKYRELHIEPDWLLLYRVEPPFLCLSRTGRHQDLLEGY